MGFKNLGFYVFLNLKNSKVQILVLKNLQKSSFTLSITAEKLLHFSLVSCVRSYYAFML